MTLNDFLKRVAIEKDGDKMLLYFQKKLTEVFNYVILTGDGHMSQKTYLRIIKEGI